MKEMPLSEGQGAYFLYILSVANHLQQQNPNNTWVGMSR